MFRLLSDVTFATVALVASLAAGTFALAQPAPDQSPAPAKSSGATSKAAPAQNQCFLITQFEDWRAPDDKTMYIRVNLNEYFRIGMSGECPELTYPDPHLITVWRGTNEACGPLDWDLKVADGVGPGSFAVPCIVKSQTRLTAAEVAAIPKKYKP
jgi:hypothetical protein